MHVCLHRASSLKIEARPMCFVEHGVLMPHVGDDWTRVTREVGREGPHNTHTIADALTRYESTLSHRSTPSGRGIGLDGEDYRGRSKGITTGHDVGDLGACFFF